jgi:hypothetical protein
MLVSMLIHTFLRSENIIESSVSRRYVTSLSTQIYVYIDVSEHLSAMTYFP